MKGYILAQLAFWVQQVLVINIEERRKDHWQMLTHHFVTISLMYGSYRYGYTRVGNLILVLMDVVDLFLPVRTLNPTTAVAATNRYRPPNASNTLGIILSATACLVFSWSLGSSHVTSSTSWCAGLFGPMPHQ